MNSASKLCVALVVATFLRAAEPLSDLNTPRTFPEIRSKAEWQQRAAEIREHVQFSCGLWPLPPKTPLNAKIFDRIERQDYSIEKVHFETYPGFFLAGNLYRPLSSETKKTSYPAILNPHGHWKNGRMADEELGSIAARCISFARQGMIAFSYDMVGYNDTVQVDHKFASNPTNLLWNISLMGLQTWNSIRALDFLESLPDVDKSRLACTGESGGGTQTFILGAIDQRLAAQAPIVMVSHSMQGGCLCENAPGLRVDYSNMEIAAAPAPRPQAIVGATGDWTKSTMKVEGPAIENIYKLFRAEDRFDYHLFDYAHNYNQTSREAVYASFGKWLLKESDPSRLEERPYKKEADADLRVFPNSKLPPSAFKEPELIESMVRIYSDRLNDIKPLDSKSLKNWQKRMLPAWEHALQLQHVDSLTSRTGADLVTLRRRPGHAQITLTVHPPAPSAPKGPLVLRLGQPENDDLADQLRAKGATIATIKPEGTQSSDEFKDYFHTYNRTRAQDNVANIKIAAAYLRDRFPRSRLVLLGETDSASVAALFAAPLADAVIVDARELDETADADLLQPGAFFPGIRRLGSLQGIAALAAPNPLFVHNIKDWQHDWLANLYSDKKDRFHHQTTRASDAEIVAWIGRHR